MNAPFRTRSGGHIDRTRVLRFQFDGRGYQGHPGDTLASALLANGVRLVGRSFKLHRPRGVFATGAEEPNALAEMRGGARREPNTRMTMVELYEGLEAASQNRFPSLRFDLMAAAGLVAPMLSAGFYYKTFMWPASFWEKLYEPLIRRAAGLGRASGLADPDRYEAMHAHCDVLVVGSGAAGLAAARVAGASGARVILCEQDFVLGGGLLAERAQEQWREQALAALAAMPEVLLLSCTTVFGYYDCNVVGAVQRVAEHLPQPPPHMPRQRSWTIRARSVVLATGAHERFIAFPGNDRPGVMLAGAAQTYATRFGVRAGRRALFFANNDAAYDSLFALQDAELQIAGAVDARPDSAGAAAARERGIAVWTGAAITGAAGRTSLHGVRVRLRNGGEMRLATDLLCVSGGINPAVHLASQSGTPLVWDDRLASFVPGAPVQEQHSAGAAAGITGIAAAAAAGARAGTAAATAAGFIADASIELPCGEAPDPTVLPVWEVKARGKAFVDIQDDVTTEDIRLACREGYRHIEHAKRYTTHTMGTDQGKTGGLVGAAVLAEARGERVQDVGLPTFRPFVTPVTWGAIAGARVGHHYAPQRLTPMHDWHKSQGAAFIDAGAWLRPGFYKAAGDTDDWASVLREARAVRRAVGICDVSTLGKIDVQGANAAAFLDRVYANTMSSLPVGRARYGLMLREDGIAFDDGTVSRFAPDHFFVTTTTANADAVMAHLEFHLQTCWPELDVQLASVTDTFASMSIAGPRAREMLAQVVRGLDLSNQAFPFMAIGEARVADCPVRVFRISFSGELAYEVAAPWGYGLAVWEAILRAGAAFGIQPYGMEALGLLRIEKGHVAGPELNGQTTAADLGLGRMLKPRGDFIGRALAERPGLIDPDRPRLVGVMASQGNADLRAGAHLVEAGSTASLGWVSSVTRSVELERWIGLALLRGGAQRIGTRLHAAFPLRNETIEVEMVSPHFVDPENLRVRA
jgi:heterotetrameric sarcosine oxidase alpha subunit